MELFCCVMSRRSRCVGGNPLEGRRNLRLEGHPDFDESAEREESGQEQRPDSRPHFSGRQQLPPSKQLLEVPRRASNGLPHNSAFQYGASSSSKDIDVQSDAACSNVSAAEDAQANEIASPGHSELGEKQRGSEEVNATHRGNDEIREKESSPELQPKSSEMHARQASRQQTEASMVSLHSQASTRDSAREQVEEYAKRLRKTLWKYPSGGKGLLRSGLKERFFSIVLPKNSSRSNKAPKNPAVPSLCYWEDMKASSSEEPLGSVPISSIKEVVYNKEEERGLEVKIQTSTKDKKDQPVVLILKFATPKEAKSWSNDLKAFCASFQKWSSNQLDDTEARVYTQSMCSQSTNVSLSPASRTRSTRNNSKY